jgi:phage/plasmid-associated DNA primase
MSLSKTLFVLPLFGLAAFVAAGCKGSTPEAEPKLQKAKSELTEIYEIYQAYTKQNQQPPKQLSDLKKKEFEGIYPVGSQALQKGTYVAVYGIAGKDSGTVLAYEKDTPTSGGAVIMADGTVKTMSADEFKAAKH